LKELINRGGEKISPIEVEAILLTHAAVTQAVVFAAADRKYGEIVMAAVVLRHEATERALREYCAAHVADFKVPVRIFVLDDIPRGPTGKVQRRHLSALLTDEQ
jgi:acyl-CoA synthetase (AMP-forming)/AMP-acid ligase II